MILLRHSVMLALGLLFVPMSEEDYPSNRTFINNNFSQDSIVYKHIRCKELVDNFTNRETIINGVYTRNIYYHPAFARIIERMKAAPEIFEFIYQTKNDSSYVEYNGERVNIVICNPGNKYGTASGQEGVLFEEVKHVEQFLNGEVFFFKEENGRWGIKANLFNEVEAKIFAAEQLGYDSTRILLESKSGRKYIVPTHLGYLMSLPNDTARALFLKIGAKAITVYEPYTRLSAITIDFDSAYYHLDMLPVLNPYTQRIKNDSIFVYPKRKHTFNVE
jgi:hypothetical protein